MEESAEIRYNTGMSAQTRQSITTGRGDKGETGLRQGQRVSKTDVRPEALGVVDELNALLGVVRAEAGDRALQSRLFRIQNHLFIAGAEIAAPGQDDAGPRIDKGVARMPLLVHPTRGG